MSQIKTYKNIILNSLIWLMASFVFGYLSGALFMTVLELWLALVVMPGAIKLSNLIFLYKVGLEVAFALFIRMAPIFLALSITWLTISKKIHNFDKSWAGVILFTLIIGTITGFMLQIRGFWIIGFVGGWLGTLLPRVIIKKMRPGKLI